MVIMAYTVTILKENIKLLNNAMNLLLTAILRESTSKEEQARKCLNLQYMLVDCFSAIKSNIEYSFKHNHLPYNDKADLLESLEKDYQVWKYTINIHMGDKRA